MVHVIVRHKVKDYDAWKKGFDAVHEKRRAGGELSSTVFRDDKDPHMVTVLNEWTGMDQARIFMSSPELPGIMKHAGVIGTPEMIFMEEMSA
jgi:quinol monooxygenase YgiN